jgi:hypothetical protein
MVDRRRGRAEFADALVAEGEGDGQHRERQQDEDARYSEDDSEHHLGHSGRPQFIRPSLGLFMGLPQSQHDLKAPVLDRLD